VRLIEVFVFLLTYMKLCDTCGT